jgi:hypothetical protein
MKKIFSGVIAMMLLSGIAFAGDNKKAPKKQCTKQECKKPACKDKCPKTSCNQTCMGK